MRIGVEVVTFNRPLDFCMLLTSLYNQSFKDWDLIVVDSSTQPIVGIKQVSDLMHQIRLNGHMVEYKHFDVRRDIGTCRNEAMRLDPNDVCVRIDDDSVLDIDYLEKLVFTYQNYGSNVGAVGGIVPLFGQPRTFRTLSPQVVFNRIKFDGNKFEIADDGGIEYDTSDGKAAVVYNSDHLRSSFLFNKKAVIDSGWHPLEYGMTGFREETDLCMRLKMNGYRLFTNVEARCWHTKSPTGGARIPDYGQAIAMNEDHFQRKFRRFKDLGKLNGVFEGC
jgi:GT2 family glycosyltransferase